MQVHAHFCIIITNEIKAEILIRLYNLTKYKSNLELKLLKQWKQKQNQQTNRKPIKN